MSPMYLYDTWDSLFLVLSKKKNDYNTNNHTTILFFF